MNTTRPASFRSKDLKCGSPETRVLMRKFRDHILKCDGMACPCDLYHFGIGSCCFPSHHKCCSYFVWKESAHAMLDKIVKHKWPFRLTRERATKWRKLQFGSSSLVSKRDKNSLNLKVIYIGTAVETVTIACVFMNLSSFNLLVFFSLKILSFIRKASKTVGVLHSNVKQNVNQLTSIDGRKALQLKSKRVTHTQPTC